MPPRFVTVQCLSLKDSEKNYVAEKFMCIIELNGAKFKFETELNGGRCNMGSI